MRHVAEDVVKRTWKDDIESRIRERLTIHGKTMFMRKFCTEVSISNQSTYDRKAHADYVIMTFLKKYDKHFDRHIHILEHTSISQDVMDWEIVGNEVLVPVINPKTKTRDTFIYIRSGWRLTDGMDDARRWTWEGHSYDLRIIFFGKLCKYLQKELIAGLDNLTNTDGSLFVYDVSSMGDSDKAESLRVVCHPSNERTLDSMVFSNNEDKRACALIDQYYGSKDFFEKRNLHYKTGMLLYGKPGCGKSSLVNALSTKYRRSIISISVPDLERIDLPELTEMINCDNLKYIILLEEIDTVFTLNRKDENGEDVPNKDDKKVISKLLNFLDSNSSPNDVIFIATTNYVERLDSALTRSGRFDLLLEINPLNEEDARKMVASFDINENGVSEIIHKYDKEHSQESVKTYNQSDLQAMAMEYIGKGRMIVPQEQESVE